MPTMSKVERQLRKTNKGWVDAASDAVVAAGETLIAEMHRAKVLAEMDGSDPVIKAAKAKK